MRLNPQTIKQWQRFRRIKRGYYSLIVLIVLLVATLIAELLVNSRAIAVKYDGEFYFPTYADYMPGRTFGLDYSYETNYRELAAEFERQRAEAAAAGEPDSGNW